MQRVGDDLHGLSQSLRLSGSMVVVMDSLFCHVDVLRHWKTLGISGSLGLKEASVAALSINNAINALTVRFLRDQVQTQLLAHDTCKETAHRMCLPVGRLHDSGDGRPFLSSQHRQNAILL